MKYEIIINEQSDIQYRAASFYAAKKLIARLRKIGFKVYSAIIVDVANQIEYEI